MVLEIVWPKKMLDPKTMLDLNIFLVPKNLMGIPKVLGPTKFWARKFLSAMKILGHRNIWSVKIVRLEFVLVRKIYW